MKLIWKPHASHMSATKSKSKNCPVPQPWTISHECFTCFTERSLPERVYATTAVRSVEKVPYLLSLLANTGCQQSCFPWRTQSKYSVSLVIYISERNDGAVSLWIDVLIFLLVFKHFGRPYIIRISNASCEKFECPLPPTRLSEDSTFSAIATIVFAICCPVKLCIWWVRKRHTSHIMHNHSYRNIFKHIIPTGLT